MDIEGFCKPGHHVILHLFCCLFPTQLFLSFIFGGFKYALHCLFYLVSFCNGKKGEKRKKFVSLPKYSVVDESVK